MKRNISDLLDRYPAENLELDGRTPYSPSRIKEITMNNINQTKSKDLKPNRTAKRFKPAQLLIAAAVVAALSVSALAAGRAFGAGELFQDFFATEGNPLSQGQLDTIDRLGHAAGEATAQLPASVTQNGATITPLAVIADENVYYIRLRVDAPAGTTLPDLDGDTQGYYQLPATLESPEGAYTEFGYNQVKTDLTDNDPTDNCKEFVLCFCTLEGETDLQFNDGRAKTLTISGLWIQAPDKKYTPIFTGDFVFDFGLSFQSRTIDLDAGGLTWHDELLDYTNTIQSMSLSPLSLTYRVDCSLPVNDHIGPAFGDIKIVLKDGTVFFSEAQDYDAMQQYIQSQPVTLPITGEPIGVFRNYIPFDQPLDLTQVDYVQYGDNKIPVSVE